MNKKLAFFVIAISFISGGIGGIATQSFRASASQANSISSAGGGGNGITSINADTHAAQVISAGTNIATTNTVAGTTTIVGSSTPTVTTMVTGRGTSCNSGGQPAIGIANDFGICSAATQDLDIMTGGTLKWEFNNNGHMYPTANHTYDIGLGETNQEVRQVFATAFHQNDFGSAVATNTTDTTILSSWSTCAGAPTGSIANPTGSVYMIYDTTNHKIWVNDTGSGTWKGVVVN